jgi:hypothetical protein
MRDFDPSIGRYIEGDPIGVVSGRRPIRSRRLNHLYGYVDSNPLKYSDPLGLIKWTGTVSTYGYDSFQGEIYELESECKCGRKVIATVRAMGLTYGGGKGIAQWQGAELEDSYACPNKEALEGDYFNSSAGAAVYWGTGFSLTILGDARSPGSWQASQGLGIGAGTTFGSAKVLEDHTYKCACDQK